MSGKESKVRRYPATRIADVESLLFGDVHLVVIHNENGEKGVGQSANWAYPSAVHEVVKTFREYLIGRDPFQIERHWQHLYRMGAFRGADLSAAVSAVDIALWDLKGRLLEVPVWELLGGRYRDHIPLYCIVGGATPEELAKASRWALAEGFSAVKFDPLPTGYQDMGLSKLIAEASRRTEAVRDEIGEKADLILEIHRKLTPLMASPLLAALDRFLPLFIEDPVQIDSIHVQGDVARKSPSPNGNGERLHSLWEFRELLEHGGSQYVRLDLGLAGGISHCKKIAALAEAYSSTVVSHNWLGPVLTAASIQLDAVIPNFLIQEYLPIADERPENNGLFQQWPRREGGIIRVPEAPGIGVELAATPSATVKFLDYELYDIPLRKDGSVAFAV
jgi:galactonate dehydratase